MYLLTPIRVISLASELEQAEIVNQIRNLGYGNVAIFDANSQASLINNRYVSDEKDKDHNIVCVLQIKKIDQRKEVILSSFLRKNASKVLGLFQHNDSNWDPDIVSLCNDVAVWPCSDVELSCRIRRLAGIISERKKVEKNLFIKLNILGESPTFTEVLDKVTRLSQCDVPVYIDGETGTGKELIARAIHYVSARNNHPFVPANCGALPDNLIENELFGHERGAFTDAKGSQNGLVAHAEGGTLFLDEIEALSAKAQVVLLRFIQDFEYRPLGSNKLKKANVRLLTASNESLQKLVKEGKFRDDLYYRLNIMHVSLPPLRERSGDIPMLASHFLNKFEQQYRLGNKTIHPSALDGMLRYDWPGNVRELENLLHREYLLAEEPYIKIKNFENHKEERRLNKHDRRESDLFNTYLHDAKQKLVCEFEKKYIHHVLSVTKGNVSSAARIAGKERRTFTRLLDKYVIDVRSYRK